MAYIRQLSQSLVNKIAAGEVIERPASVVKEMMENAVDAGATRIHVSVDQGGTELIRVVDNGCGIPADELGLAVASHATSKLTDADDLARIGTLGFRGEALSSIGEISWLILRSRTAEEDCGAELDVSGGTLSEVVPCGCPVGTTVEVRNLFFNTPVRRKFLRSVRAEFGQVSEAFTRIALALPRLDFKLEHNGRQVFDLSGSSGMLERVAQLFGRDLADNLIWVESTNGEVRLSGYVANPTHSRSNTRMQYLFLNDRHIRDRSLLHALGEAFRGLLTVGRHPIAFLSLEMPPEMVDVNVHPTKLEVRFYNSGGLYSQLLATLRTKFLATDLTVRAQSAGDKSPGEQSAGPDDDEQDAQSRQQLIDWAKGQVASWPSRSEPGTAGYSATGESSPAGSRAPLELSRLDRPWRPAGGSFDSGGGEAKSYEPARVSEDPADRQSAPAMQMHDRYLVTETPDGVMLVDQHALHERILYEQLRERILAGQIETQNLLVPEPVDLTPVEAATALEHGELLAQLGMKVEPFGGDTVLIAGYPAMLANMDPADVLHALLDQLLSAQKTPDACDLLDELLHAIACKAAIKAGERLASEEVDALLEQRHLIENAHHCPHGRPTAVIFTREELDKQFKRG